MLAANAFLKINREKVRHALAANNPVCPDSARLSADAGLPHKARRAEDHGPAIDRWVRMPHWLKSRQGRKDPAFPRRYFPVLSETFFKENPRNNTFYAWKLHPQIPNGGALLLASNQPSVSMRHYPNGLLTPLKNPLCK